MHKQFTVTSDHDASFPDPIAFKAGDDVVLTDRTDLWDGYRRVWARAADGREGWIPDDITEVRDGRTVARKDYSATELTCQAGETLTGLWTTHGSTWCRNGAGETGWVPTRNLEPAWMLSAMGLAGHAVARDWLDTLRGNNVRCDRLCASE